ncbi:MAG: hypothetical protein EBV42_00635 [Actinobacteria bacterium]|nr:hypothetical protein [Actinomycetota bacterium]
MRICWSVKGGSGTTVFSCALAVALAERYGTATMIDLCGDVPAVLGMAEPPGRGVRDWLMSGDREASQLDALTVSAGALVGVSITLHRSLMRGCMTARGCAS